MQIQILIDRIQILISNKFAQGQDSNPYELDLNLSFKRFQEGLLEVVNLNSYRLDSNLNSRKVCLNNRIRISLKQIRNPSEEEEKTQAMDSNSCKMDSNPRKKDSITFEEFSSTSEKEKKSNSNPLYSDWNL